MAKKKSKPGPKPSPAGPRKDRLVILCQTAYKDWVGSLAKETRLSIPDMIDGLLVAHAKAVGFKAPPER